MPSMPESWSWERCSSASVLRYGRGISGRWRSGAVRAHRLDRGERFCSIRMKSADMVEVYGGWLGLDFELDGSGKCGTA
jgi:hypothetical protein